MKLFPILAIVLAFVFLGCEKEQNNKLLSPYVRYEINGKQTTFSPPDLFNNNFFDCSIKGDSAVSIMVSKLFEGAGFFIKTTPAIDGTYTLDENNKAYYTNPKDFKRYSTNGSYKGTITISRGTFQAKSLLNTLKGQFSFEAVDTATKKSVKVLKGEFFMEVSSK